MHAVPVPHELVNDEIVLLVEWLVADGGEVKAGEPIAVIETSKTTMDVEAPASGYLRQMYPKQTEVAVGAVFCYITGSPTEPLPEACESSSPPEHCAAPATLAAGPTDSGEQGSASHVSASDALPAPHPAPTSTRLSRAAKALIEKHGLNVELFQGRGLVRQREVEEYLGIRRAPPAGHATRAKANVKPATLPALAKGVSVRSEDLPRAKRLEADYLSAARKCTLPSVVSVVCPTSGLKAAANACPELGGRTLALVLYETARLLKKYPIFNAFYHDGQVHYYEQVNTGFAVDADRGLKVLVVPNADSKSVQEIAGEMDDLMLAYLDDELPPESLSGGTFTITDLSGEGVFSFHPLINRNQAAILGIGAEFFPPGSDQGMFNLILAFDHQLTEGRTAARFLGELRERLQSYELALRSSGHAPENQLECARCLRSAAELARLNAPLLQEVRANGERTLICRICLEGW